MEPGFEEWIRILDIYAYYIGVYILIALAVAVLVVSFLGCCAALVEHGLGLLIVSIYSFKELLYEHCNELYTQGSMCMCPAWGVFSSLISLTGRAT